MHTYGASFSNLSLSSVPISSRATLVEEVTLAFSFPDRAPDIVNQDKLRNVLDSVERSSQSFEVLPEYRRYLEAFLQKLNHILHLFDELRLCQNFQNALTDTTIDEELRSELFMVFALGATYADTPDQSSHLDLYIHGRVLLSGLKSWTDDMWMMRILLLIALYHLSMSPSSESHFLGELPYLMITRDTNRYATDLAIQLGQQNGLDTSTFPLPNVQEPRRSHWLRVWKSIDFLQNARSPTSEI